jgi:hypothetical protein
MPGLSNETAVRFVNYGEPDGRNCVMAELIAPDGQHFGPFPPYQILRTPTVQVFFMLPFTPFGGVFHPCVLKLFNLPPSPMGGGALAGRSVLTLRYPHSGGDLIGGASAYHAVAAGLGGALVGGSSRGEDVTQAAGGDKVGGGSLYELVLARAGGDKLGGLGVKSKPVAAAGGGLVGGASARKLRTARAGGDKVGGASATFTGIVTACCPGVAIAQTLHGTGSAGTAFTVTYNAGFTGWRFTDPDSGIVFTLQCIGTFPTAKFQPTNVQAGCTHSYVENAKSCGHPFSVTCTANLGGGSCPISGTYTFSFHE